jgi:hypothetical protein
MCVNCYAYILVVNHCEHLKIPIFLGHISHTLFVAIQLTACYYPKATACYFTRYTVVLSNMYVTYWNRAVITHFAAPRQTKASRPLDENPFVFSYSVHYEVISILQWANPPSGCNIPSLLIP